MKKIYLDMTDHNRCISVFAKEAQVIPAGTTVYSMPVTDKNAEYQRFADEYDIHFIFENAAVHLNFYTIPWIDIVATDSEGGYIGTVGEMSSLDSDAPICYIDKNRNSFLAAENFSVFLESASCWKRKLKPYDEIVFFSSKEEAQRHHEFLDIDDLLTEQNDED